MPTGAPPPSWRRRPVLVPVLAAALVPVAMPVLGQRAPAFAGDPDGPGRLDRSLEAALAATAAFGPLPTEAWTVLLHLDDRRFERVTGAPPGRAAAWVGATLHLRPWPRLARRDLGALLRHELVHRRLGPAGLPRWREEALCLWAEGHTRPPATWPPEPDPALRTRLDRALAAGTAASQAWAYRWLRAWLDGRPLPAPPPAPAPGPAWEPEGGEPPGPPAVPDGPAAPEPGAVAPEPGAVAPEPGAVAPEPEAVAPEPGAVAPEPGAVAPEPEAVALELEAVASAPAGRTVQVIWPPDRLPRTLRVAGTTLDWRPGLERHWRGPVRFGPGAPVARLDGDVRLRAVAGGWRLTWSLPAEAWIAAAAEGELGRGAPREAVRALAAVLDRWLAEHPRGNHADGSFCPLTHCAVVRGQPSPETRAAAGARPALDLEPGRARFAASLGGVALSPREVWGQGPDRAGGALRVPGDPWADWTRSLAPAQVRALKAAVAPGLAPGQRGLRLGPSGPYPVEALRLEAGRRFGWTAWPSNACTAVPDLRGGLRLAGHGLGHNAGLCLASAVHLARRGQPAEAILALAFPDRAPAGSGPDRR